MNYCLKNLKSFLNALNMKFSFKDSGILKKSNSVKKMGGLTVWNKFTMKKTRLYAIAILFLCVHFYFYTPFVLLTTDGENYVNDSEKWENVEYSACSDYLENPEIKEVSARAVLNSELSVRSGEECFKECKDGHKMEYAVFLISCFILNGGALGMVLISKKVRGKDDTTKQLEN